MRNKVINSIFCFKERIEYYGINLEYLENSDVHNKEPSKELSDSVKEKNSYSKIFQGIKQTVIKWKTG